jgi:hypothetical protein
MKHLYSLLIPVFLIFSSCSKDGTGSPSGNTFIFGRNACQSKAVQYYRMHGGQIFKDDMNSSDDSIHFFSAPLMESYYQKAEPIFASLPYSFRSGDFFGVQTKGIPCQLDGEWIYLEYNTGERTYRWKIEPSSNALSEEEMQYIYNVMNVLSQLP